MASYVSTRTKYKVNRGFMFKSVVALLCEQKVNLDNDGVRSMASHVNARTKYKVNRGFTFKSVVALLCD